MRELAGKVIRGLGRGLVLLLGEVRWSPPRWARGLYAHLLAPLGRYGATLFRPLRRHALLAGLGLLLLAGGLAAYHWWPRAPLPPAIGWRVTPPEATPLTRDARPHPLRVVFSGPVAPLALANRPVVTGITLDPPLPGAWSWIGDTELLFQPEQDWPAGQEYVVRLGPAARAPQARLEEGEISFTAAPFTATVHRAEFRQDPVDPRGREVAVVVRFSHPVDGPSLEPRVRLVLVHATEAQAAAEAGRDPVLSGQPQDFRVAYDELRGEATIRSLPLAIPPEQATIHFLLAAGVQPARGGQPLSSGLTAQATVPGLHDGCTIAGAEVTFVRNEQHDPERLLLVRTALPATRAELAAHLQVWLLPAQRPRRATARPGAAAAPDAEEARTDGAGAPAVHDDEADDKEDEDEEDEDEEDEDEEADDDEPEPARPRPAWSSPAQVGPSVLAASQLLPLTLLPGEEPATLHSFQLPPRLPAGRQLYLRVNGGLTSFGGYVLAEPFHKLLELEEFPQEIEVMHEGALLSLSGERKLSVVSRGVDQLVLELGRVLPGQLHHVVVAAQERMQSPSFSYQFDEQDFTELFREVRQVASPDPARARYTVIDFGRYLAAASNQPGYAPRGLFLLRVAAWNPRTKQREQPQDERLVLLTDLGLFRKQEARGQELLFVVSLRTGQPVAGASVDVISRNGLPLLTRTTDQGGQATFPPLGDFQREQVPVAFVVRHGPDLSFLPYDGEDRRVEVERFDVGGRRTEGQPQQLAAYLFSDRGLYRPEETFRIGIVVRAVDWALPLEGIPLLATISDPRGSVVHREPIRLPASGFSELSYTPDRHAPTGTYSVDLLVARDKRPSRVLGSTSVRVREFLPDRLRIAARLTRAATTPSAPAPATAGSGTGAPPLATADRLPLPGQGWILPEQLRGQVELHNLFGTPATDRQVKAQLELEPLSPYLSAFPEHQFQAPRLLGSYTREELPEQRTDEQGQAQFPIELGRFDAGCYRLTFRAEGLEAEAGRGVAAAAQVMVVAAPWLLGFRAEGDLRELPRGSRRRVEVLAVEPDGRPRAVTELRQVLIEQQSIRSLVRRYDGSYFYQTVQQPVARPAVPLTVPAGGATLTLPTQAAGTFRLELQDGAGVTRLSVGYSVAGGANLAARTEREGELKLTLAETEVVPGAPVRFQLVAPYGGIGLATLEQDRVLAHRWFRLPVGQPEADLELTLPAEVEAGAYLQVALVRDLASPDVFTRPFVTGVVPFSISRAARQLPIQLTTPRQARPGEPLTIGYATPTPSRIVVYAVDSGILQLARHSPPDPLGHFLGQRALEVTTFQNLDLLLPEHSLVRQQQGAGGDEDAAALGQHQNPFRRRREPPAVYWSGLLDAGPAPRQLTWPVPVGFAGMVQVFAVAVGARSMGVAHQPVVIRGPFVLQPNAPLAVAPGDRFEVSVLVARQLPPEGETAATGPVEVLLEPRGPVAPAGPTSQWLPLRPGAEATLRFVLQAGAEPGEAELHFTARVGNEVGRGLATLAVRPATPFRTTLHAGVLTGKPVEVELTRQLLAYARQREVTVSPLPLGLGRGLARYLEQYPHGCTEQLVSQAVPQWIALEQPALVREPARARGKLERVLGVLASRQRYGGGFGLWSAGSDGDDGLDVYVLQFLTELQPRGLPQVRELTRPGLDLLRSLARRDEDRTLRLALLQAQALYLLARHDQRIAAELAGLRGWLAGQAEASWRGSLIAAYLAATYQLLHDPRQAEQLLAGIDRGPGSPPHPPGFPDPQTQLAQHFTLLARHFPARARELAPTVLPQLARGIDHGAHSTQAAAHTLFALAAYSRLTPEQAGQGVRLTVEELAETGDRTPVRLGSGPYAGGGLTPTARRVRLAPSDSRLLFYEVTEAGFDREAPRVAEQHGLEVFRELLDDGGRPVTRVKLGATVHAHVKLRTLDGETVRDVAVVDLLPGGCEAVLGNAEDDDPLGRLTRLDRRGWQPQFADLREDRVVLYGQAEGQVAEYAYALKAVARGRFLLPPAHATAMYDLGRSGTGAVGVIEVE